MCPKSQLQYIVQLHILHLSEYLKGEKSMIKRFGSTMRKELNEDYLEQYAKWQKSSIKKYYIYTRYIIPRQL